MYYLGVDLGGTNISAGLVNDKGAVIQKLSVPTLKERGSEIIFSDIANLCLRLIEENNLKLKNINSIGIGFPGVSNEKKDIIVYSCNLEFNDIDINKEIKKYFDLPIYAENDANCAALGESICGSAVGCKSSITITLGTGVGCGIILDNKIYSGAFCGGTEVGHTVIVVDGEPCSCGRKGCWEAYASATALIRETRVITAKYPDSKIFELVGGDIKQIDAKVAFDAAELGDKYAKHIIDEYYKYLAVGIANLINIFEPEKIAIGGGVSAQGEKLIKPVTKLVKGMVYGGKMKTSIVKAKLGNDAGIVGAAMLGKL